MPTGGSPATDIALDGHCQSPESGDTTVLMSCQLRFEKTIWCLNGFRCVLKAHQSPGHGGTLQLLDGDRIVLSNDVASLGEAVPTALAWLDQYGSLFGSATPIDKSRA